MNDDNVNPTNYYTSEEAKEVTNKTTEEQLLLLADALKATPSDNMELKDDNIPIDDTSDSDEDYAPIEKKRKQISKSSVLSASDRIYMDNQDLWNKLSKTTAQFERTEERLRYVQLDLNTKHVDFEKQKIELKRLRIISANQLKELKCVKYYYSTVWIYLYILFTINIIVVLHGYFGINLFSLTFKQFYFLYRYYSWTIEYTLNNYILT